MQKIIIIGAGFSALSAACYLAKEGHHVTVLEKNKDIGGRARQLKQDGFVFDIGPSFYWMPDVFENFFKDFGKKTSDYYHLDRLQPGYQVYFGPADSVKIDDNLDSIKNTFETIEGGSAQQLDRFIKAAENNYELAIKDLVYQPGRHPFEIITKETIKKLPLFFSTIRSQVAKVSQHPKLKKILEFPVLFLGAKPNTTPAFYNFMNYADFVLGTWHPRGGMYEVVRALEQLARSLGVDFITETAVEKIEIKDKSVTGVYTKSSFFSCDILLSGADYEHTESLLEPPYRQYSQSFWAQKTFAPSALLFYVGFDKKLENVSHHTLFFDADFDEHAISIYDTKTWPQTPLFYASFPSITDSSVAPTGKEAAVFLIPLAPDLEDTPELREKYFKIILERLEKNSQQSIEPHILFKHSYCIKDFKKDYNAYKGNAYGLANTLLQTHFLRPRIKSKKVDNLYFTGQLTVPGPGVPPAIISGKIAAQQINQSIKHYEHNLL